MSNLPADRFGLLAIRSFERNGIEYTLYSDDGGFAEVAASNLFELETDAADYTEWCQDVCNEDEAVYAAAAEAWGRGFNSGAHGRIDDPA